MIIFESKRTGVAEGGEGDVSLSQPVSTTSTPILSGPVAKKPAGTPIQSGQAAPVKTSAPTGAEDINPDDIPF